MASYNLSIDYQAIRDCANDMEDVNKKLREKLESISNEMKAVNTEDVYFSTDAQDCLEKFNAMATKRIPQFYDVIEGYVKFLNTAVETYESTNKTLQSNVESNIDAFV